MTEFEEQMQRALARREPSADFALRVLNAAAADKPPERLWNEWLRDKWNTALRFAPVMAALALAAGGAFFQQRQRLEQGELAKHQLLVAVRIAGEKLHNAQQQVVSIGVEESVN
jgi:hypothetical protein